MPGILQGMPYGSDHTHKYIKNLTRGKHASFLARAIGKKDKNNIFNLGRRHLHEMPTEGTLLTHKHMHLLTNFHHSPTHNIIYQQR